MLREYIFLKKLIEFQKIDIIKKELLYQNLIGFFNITIPYISTSIYTTISVYAKSTGKYLKNKKRANFEASVFQKY